MKTRWDMRSGVILLGKKSNSVVRNGYVGERIKYCLLL